MVAIRVSRVLLLLLAIAVATITFGGGKAAKQGSSIIPFLQIRLISGAEYASRTSNTYYSDKPGVTQTTDHCLELGWQYTTAPVSSSGTTTGSSTTTSSTTGTTGVAAVAGKAAGVVVEAQATTTGTTGVTPPTTGTPTTGTTTTGTTGSTTTTGGTTSTGTTGTTGTGGCGSFTYTKGFQGYFVGFDPLPSTGAAAGFGTNITFTQGSGTYNPTTAKLMSADGNYINCNRFDPGTTMPIEWHGSGVLPGGGFNLHLFNVSYGWGSNDNVNWTLCYSSQTETQILVGVSKVPVQVAPIDSRQAYADADTIPTDANTSSRNLNFSNNIYYGGAFIGNMGATNSQGDRSGTARLQVYPGLSSSTVSGASLMVCSFLHSGNASYASGDLSVGAYCPLLTDPNLPGATNAPSASTATWATRWNINPRTSLGSPPDYSQDPLALTNLLGTGSTNKGSQIGDYASFQVTNVTDYPYTTSSGTTAYSTVVTIPATAGQAICLASYNEASYVTNNTSLWHWFVNPPYPTTGLAYPYTDAAPRVWVVTGIGLDRQH